MNDSKAPRAVQAPGFFRSTLKGWGNNDLLITRAARDAARAENPAIFRVLDWEEFRNAFAVPEKAAIDAKKKSRQVAVWAACAAGIGASLLALAPLFLESLIPIGAGVGIVLTVGGVTFAAYHLIQHDGRQKWLVNRARAERLRQFYFQFLINNLTLACDAIADETSFRPFNDARQAALNTVQVKLEQDETQRPNLIINDHRHTETWLQTTWRTPSPLPPEDTPAHRQLDAFLDRLATQRIGIQQHYAESNREIAINTPIAQHSTLDTASNILTLAVMGAAIWGGFTLISGTGFELPIALVGVCGALGVSARLLQRGLSLRADIERYDWYAEVVDSCSMRFESGGIGQKILALRDLEGYAYGELRQFLRAHRYESVL